MKFQQTNNPKKNTGRPLHIGIISFSGAYGGLEMTLLNFAEQFQRKEDKSTVLGRLGTPIMDEARRKGISTIALSPLFKYPDPVTALRLRRLCKELGIDILLSSQSKDAGTLRLATMSGTGTRVVYFQQMQSGVPKRDPYHTWAFGGYSRWITLTEQMRRESIQCTRYPAERIVAIPLGIDLEVFDPSRYDPIAARKGFGIPMEKTVVGVIGRLDRQKGQDVLLKAAPSLLQKHPNLHFLLAGEETRGEEGFKAELINLVDSLRLSSAVQFLPFTKDVPRLLSGIDIVCLTSLSETYGLITLEAMAMKKPVVATNAGGVPEIVEEGVTGLLVPPSDPNELAHAIDMILSHPEEARTMALAASSAVQNRFDEKKQFGKFRECLFIVLSPKAEN